MSRKDRRSFLRAAVAASVTPLVAKAQDKTDAPVTRQKRASITLPEGMSSVVSICGDLRREPVFVANLKRGVLSEPITLEGNGTYRISLTPVKRTAGGSQFKVVLADAAGERLAQMNIGTSTRTVFSEAGLAVFPHYGVMIHIAHI